jgi:hypothetical protein
VSGDSNNGYQSRGWVRRWVKWGLLAVIGGFLLIQLVPYGRAHDNPPVLAEPAWDSPQTRELAVRACFDCHSNETVWPWYTNIAPMSWLVQRDVDQGRDELNFSEWSDEQDGDDAAETVADGSMPPRRYLLAHPDARLTDAELAALTAGLTATFGDGHGGNGDDGNSGEGGGGDDEEERDDY